MDRPDYNLSDINRIRFVRDSLALWLKNNRIEMYELNRAIAMLMREADEQRKREALERRQH